MKEETKNPPTLREAYEVWAQENPRLAAKYRSANKKVLLDKYGDLLITEFKEDFIKKIFAEDKNPKDEQARADSTLHQILKMMAKVKKVEEKIRRPGLPANARPILKLDPKTLEVVHEYDCISDACKDMKLTNLSTYIKHHYKAAGFYWAYPEHLDITRDEIRNKEQAREVVRNPKKPLGGIVTPEAMKPHSAYNKPEPVKPLKGKDANEALLKAIEEMEEPQININVGLPEDVPIPSDLYVRLQKLGIIPNDVRGRNVGASDYSQHLIQPWAIWMEYDLNPWDADIIKRVLRHKSTDTRKMDYEKIIHICQERIRQLEADIKNNIQK